MFEPIGLLSVEEFDCSRELARNSHEFGNVESKCFAHSHAHRGEPSIAIEAFHGCLLEVFLHISVVIIVDRVLKTENVATHRPVVRCIIETRKHVGYFTMQAEKNLLNLICLLVQVLLLLNESWSEPVTYPRKELFFWLLFKKCERLEHVAMDFIRHIDFEAMRKFIHEITESFDIFAVFVLYGDCEVIEKFIA